MKVLGEVRGGKLYPNPLPRGDYDVEVVLRWIDTLTVDAYTPRQVNLLYRWRKGRNVTLNGLDHFCVDSGRHVQEFIDWCYINKIDPRTR